MHLWWSDWYDHLSQIAQQVKHPSRENYAGPSSDPGLAPLCFFLSCKTSNNDPNLLSWNKRKCILPQGITCENKNKNVAFIRIKVAWVFLCRHDLKFSKSAQRQCQWRMLICLLWQQGLKTTLELIWRISAERYNSVIVIMYKNYIQGSF